MEKKKLPIGTQTFLTFAENGLYYVDKTPFIRSVMEADDEVLLFTRPRRFGKTLFMSTVKSFLEVNPENPGDRRCAEKQFSGLKISEDKAFCERFMAQCPTVFLSLKEVHGETFDDAYQKLVHLVPFMVLYKVVH